jgi:hypothetical protein
VLRVTSSRGASPSVARWRASPTVVGGEGHATLVAVKVAATTLLALVASVATALACASRTAPVDERDAALCDAAACVRANLVVGGAYRYQHVTPCASMLQRAYNKGLNETSSCAVTLPACGTEGVSVEAIDAALADPDVQRALRATSSVFTDASREGPWFQVLVGTVPWDGYFHPSDEGLHEITVQTACSDPGCVPAPAGILRLARVLEALAALCEPR